MNCTPDQLMMRKVEVEVEAERGEDDGRRVRGEE